MSDMLHTRSNHEVVVVRGGDGRIALDIRETNGRRLAIVWLERGECLSLAGRLLGAGMQR